VTTGKLAALTMMEEGERGELEIYFGEKLDPDLQASFQQFVHDHLKAKAADVESSIAGHCAKSGRSLAHQAASSASAPPHQ